MLKLKKLKNSQHSRTFLFNDRRKYPLKIVLLRFDFEIVNEEHYEHAKIFMHF